MLDELLSPFVRNSYNLLEKFRKQVGGYFRSLRLLLILRLCDGRKREGFLFKFYFLSV